MRVLEIIKEATKDHINDDTFKVIEEGVTAEVNKLISEKTDVAVRVALEKQDAEYADSLKTLVEKLDEDRAAKIQLALETMETDHIDKFLTLKESYNKIISKQAVGLRNELRTTISKYLNIQLEKAIPTATIKEAAKENFSRRILSEARKLFSIDDIRKNKVVMEGLQDGVAKINQLTSELAAANKNVKTLKEAVDKSSAAAILNEKTESLPETKVAYLKNFFNGKKADYIKENFDYVLSLYDKEESERRHKVSEETKELRRRSNVDRVLKEKSDDADFNPPANPEAPNRVSEYISGMKQNDSRRYGNA